jgi:alkyldihydroxyacetonephosphate synthase
VRWTGGAVLPCSCVFTRCLSSFVPARVCFVLVPEPIINDEFVAALKSLKGGPRKWSMTGPDRLFHGHGHTCQELFALRYGHLARVPDLVVWPSSHDEVVALVACAQAHDVVLIPFGGGTTVSHAVLCPAEEKRMIVSVDTHDMNR